MRGRLCIATGAVKAGMAVSGPVPCRHEQGAALNPPLAAAWEGADA